MNTKTIVQLKSKEEFKQAKEKYKETSFMSWELYRWDWFKTNTCYIVEDDCFINLGKAIELGFLK